MQDQLPNQGGSGKLVKRVTERRLARAGLEGLPAVIAQAGEKAGRRFVEFFTANIRNKNTRLAYGRAANTITKAVTRKRRQRRCNRAPHPHRRHPRLSAPTHRPNPSLAGVPQPRADCRRRNAQPRTDSRLR